MKILFSNIHYLPKMGGVETYIKNIAKELVGLGHEVSVVCYHYDNSLPEKENIDGVNIIRILKNQQYPGTYKEENQIIVPIINEVIEKNNIDIYIAGRITLIGDHNVKTVCIPPTILSLYETQRSMKNPNWVWFNDLNDIKAIEKNSLEKSDLVITLSNFVKKNLVDIYDVSPDKIKVIPPGVEKKNHSPEQLQEIKDKFNLNNKKIALMVGRLSEEKNPESLIKAFKHVNSNATLLIVGGEQKKINELKQLVKELEIKNEVIFTGWQNASPFYEIADVYVLPSFSESFGLVLLEAMITGVPCIAFQPNGKDIRTASEELITNNENGFLVKDEKEMGEKIDLILSNNELRKQMSENSIKKAKTYNWEDSTKNIVNELTIRGII